MASADARPIRAVASEPWHWTLYRFYGLVDAERMERDRRDAERLEEAGLLAQAVWKPEEIERAWRRLSRRLTRVTPEQERQMLRDAVEAIDRAKARYPRGLRRDAHGRAVGGIS